MGSILLLFYAPGLVMFVYLLWRFLSMPKWPAADASLDELEKGLEVFRKWEKKANIVGGFAMAIAFLLTILGILPLIIK